MGDWFGVLVFGLVFIIPIILMVLPLWYDRYRIEYQRYNRKTDRVIIPVLEQFPFYLNLTEKARTKFIQRVRFIASRKTFEGKNGLEVTDYMRVRISASIVQISFGLHTFKLLNVKKIQIYPDVFYSPIIKRNVKGIAGRGIIALSWPDFQHGYENPNDNFNLGLHEIAHALQLSANQSKEDTEFLAAHFENFQQSTQAEFLQLRNGETTFLRSYGATNPAEFFAVCVEYFFESPEAFKKELPELYVKLMILLNLDPLEERNDYKPNIRPQIKAQINEVFGVRPNWFQYKSIDVKLIMIGAFLGTFILNMVTEKFALNYLDKFLILLVLSMIPISLYQWAKKNGFYQHVLIYILFCFFGFAMNLLVILLIFNQLLPAKEVVETHKVVGVNEFKGIQDDFYHYQLEHGTYSRYPYLLKGGSPYKQQPNILELRMRKGFLGIPEITRLTEVYTD